MRALCYVYSGAFVRFGSNRWAGETVDAASPKGVDGVRN